MKRIVLLAAGVLAALSLTAAPASAGGVGSSNLCSGWEAANSASFSSLGSLTASASTARGIGRGEPNINANFAALPLGTDGQADPSFDVTVPVAFHVIIGLDANGDRVGDLTDAQIAAQITVLNLAYAGFYGGYDTGFSFELESVTRTFNPTWFTARLGGGAERDMKSALRQGGFETLNIYTSLAGGYLGYAYYPGLPDSRQYLDGAVIHWASVPGASTLFAGRYDLGQTLTHEVGHWLALAHTFEGACNAKGDEVADTPAMAVPTSGCPAGKDTCVKEPGLDPIENFMDYSYDSCYEAFTEGQADRAQEAWNAFRDS
jgi:pregnancy-associated plasma protein-A